MDISRLQSEMKSHSRIFILKLCAAVWILTDYIQGWMGNYDSGEGGDDVNSPVSGSAGRSDSRFLDAREDLTGTGKNPRRKRVIPITSDIKISVAKTDERTFIMQDDGSTQLAAKDVSHNG